MRKNSADGVGGVIQAFYNRQLMQYRLFKCLLQKKKVCESDLLIFGTRVIDAD